MKYFSFEKWYLFEDELKEAKVTSLDHFKRLLNGLGVDDDLLTLDAIYKNHLFSEERLIKTLDDIRIFALKLPIYFPTMKIPRLSKDSQHLELKRIQVLCLLCNMFLCTIEKNKENMYWVNFKNWLTDGRPCCICYLQILIEFFCQSFSYNDYETSEYMNELIVFHRSIINDPKLIMKILDEEKTSEKICKINVKLSGSIGDEINSDSAEVDFANCDIGFGITGTQEEMLFGTSPEMCIAMLFCDTMNDNEAIIIKGTRKVAYLNGYGLNISFKSTIPFDNRKWCDRVIIAIDSLDFSDISDDSLPTQLKENNLKRELVKAYAGFSAVETSAISTGFWGCGAFCGNKELKALLQIIAASVASKEIIFYCFEDKTFYESFVEILNVFNEQQFTCYTLWKYITNRDSLSDNSNSIFNYIKSKLKK